MSTTLKNIKVPYPTEGVIRSAQLNDTVAPENSVQIAVNMNFDRVGAVQTRPGVETYATSLTGEVKNFGTLNNSIKSNGYASILNSEVVNTFSATASNISSVKIDSTHTMLFWTGAAAKGFAQVIETNLTTGVMTLLGSPFTFDAVNNENNSPSLVDSTHIINFWCGTGQDGFAQVFTFDGGYNISTAGALLTFDTATLQGSNSCKKLDATHFINFWADGLIGKTQVFTVNLGTWAITAEGSPLTFSASNVEHNSCSLLGDGSHAINFWSDQPTGDGFVQVFKADTGTWAVTAEGSALEFDAVNGKYNSSASIGDGQHFINFWQGTGSTGYSQIFNVAPVTFAVTALSTALNFDTNVILSNSAISAGDGVHFVNFWRGLSSVGYSQIFTTNLTTFALTAQGIPESLGVQTTLGYNSAILTDPYKVLNFWAIAGNSGVGSLFSLESDPTYQNFLYAQQGNYDILSWDGANWTSRRSSLKTNRKARFAQYLNYIWMVNGNSQVGNPVQTSNGGAFGTTLVPVDFPSGDSIQAGFEGRVWVMDAYADSVYYTDIVQFTPPETYTLTYNSSVNYLKNFSSQDGEKMTALWTVPRALLLFKQNHIYRIYGANSVDAYPAYNVGTFSEESIVQTKDGIYFHHSSGFYKFDYNSQPVEISRRVIDFVKAIPRTSYENIVGIWDGFDAVKWSVGSVTVEGVTYTNCQMRYTISTQVWTIYDYTGNVITALISFDNGTTISQIVGTSAGLVGKLDSGTTDFSSSIYYENISRWISFTEMYSKSKSVSGIMISSENGGGTVLEYQTEKSPANVWKYIDTVKDKFDALFPNANTDDFNSIRFRLRGNSSGTSMLFHGIEILSIQDKGLDQN